MMNTRFGAIRTIVSVGAFSALLTSLPAISETVQTTTEYVVTAAFDRLEQEFLTTIGQGGTACGERNDTDRANDLFLLGSIEDLFSLGGADSE